MCWTVSRVLSVSRTNSGSVRYPRSYAASLELNRSPRLVGEMRWVALGGISWTVSGISQFVSALLNWRKKRQVRSAVSRRKVASAKLTSSLAALNGRFSHSQKSFGKHQTTRKGHATDKELGRQAARRTAIASESDALQLR